MSLQLQLLGIIATERRTTMARRPSQARDSIQLTALKNAVVAPRHAPTQSTPCSATDSMSSLPLPAAQARHSCPAWTVFVQLLDVLSGPGKPHTSMLELPGNSGMR